MPLSLCPTQLDTHIHPNTDDSRSQGVSAQAAVSAPGRPGNPATCRRDANSAQTDVRRMLAQQSDIQIS